ncbi:hypothetical protein BDQ17DRAFT_1368035 [Cyathus striatus]|nr:hypothetical protein BDQ17DRAFT_1368035 [Cyathus striatus]
MLPSQITLDEESIISLARNSIKAIKCEWTHARNTCNAHLASWYLFQQHVLRHCRLQVAPTSKGSKQKRDYACNLPKCSARFHSSLTALESHVLQAHLARLQLPCPVKGCSLTFHRPNSLRDHFRDQHQALNHRLLKLPSDLLLPIWTPFVPRIASPPPLPPISPASSLLPTILYHASHNIAKSSDFGCSRQPHQLKRDTIPVVETLETFNVASVSTSSHKYIIRKKSQELMKDLSQPQPMCNCRNHDNVPTPSILFDVFARRLERLEQEKRS